MDYPRLARFDCHAITAFVPDRCLCDRTPANNHLLQIFPSGRSSRSVGPGIEVRDNPTERSRQEQDLDDMTSLE